MLLPAFALPAIALPAIALQAPALPQLAHAVQPGSPLAEPPALLPAAEEAAEAEEGAAPPQPAEHTVSPESSAWGGRQLPAVEGVPPEVMRSIVEAPPLQGRHPRRKCGHCRNCSKPGKLVCLALQALREIDAQRAGGGTAASEPQAQADAGPDTAQAGHTSLQDTSRQTRAKKVGACLSAAAPAPHASFGCGTPLP